MTNKEATYVLEDIKRTFATREDGEPFTATYNALNKAIKLLEQMPDEHGDLVCYDEVKEEFDKLLSYMEETPDEISNIVWFRREYILPHGYEMKFHVIVKAERKDELNESLGKVQRSQGDRCEEYKEVFLGEEDDKYV